ncbi:hypothetical protein [Chitinophaga sp. MM2321]|uniref:hypothetical protein n=1 Tax=Chitinophaga sp. MM2321 TaxID=3137178 RepID=UPI0032D56C32
MANVKKSVPKSITFRVSEELEKQINNLYDSKGGAAEKIVPAYFELRKYSLGEIKGFFTKEEVNALTDSLNGIIQEVDFQANKGIAIAHLYDFQQYESGISRHGATPDILLDKVNKLTASQVYFLQEEINIFWGKGKQFDFLYDTLL